MTKSSGEAMRAVSAALDPGRFHDRRALAAEAARHLGVAARAHARSPSAGRRCRSSRRWKPSAIDSTAVKTMTTPAMPMIATIDEPRRCGIERRVTPVTAMIWRASS